MLEHWFKDVKNMLEQVFIQTEFDCLIPQTLTKLRINLTIYPVTRLLSVTSSFLIYIEFYQQWLDIAREMGDRNGEAIALSGLGSAYEALGQHQKAFEFHQYSLDIRRDLDDRNGEANAWFHLGLVLDKINRESEAMNAFCKAREIYYAMGIDASLQDCNHAIELLSQNVASAPHNFWFGRWLSNVSQLIKSGSK